MNKNILKYTLIGVAFGILIGYSIGYIAAIRDVAEFSINLIDVATGSEKNLIELLITIKNMFNTYLPTI